MRANTDSKALRRRDALKNAVSSSLLQLAAGTLLLWFRSSLEPSRPLAILLLAAVLASAALPGDLRLHWRRARAAVRALLPHRKVFHDDFLQV